MILANPNHMLVVAQAENDYISSALPCLSFEAHYDYPLI